MSLVYIVSSSGNLKCSNGLLYYYDRLGNSLKIFPESTEELVIFGNLNITAYAMRLIFKHKIPVMFFQKNGKYNSRLVYEDSKNVMLRHRQHILAEDSEFCLRQAKAIVHGKLDHQYRFLQRIQRNLADEELSEVLLQLNSLRHKVGNVSTLDEVRGMEGAGAAFYFSQLSKNVKPVWARFSRRTKNPPADPFNSVLSLLYTVLANRLEGLVRETGLDASVGTLHALTYGRSSLVFDLIEEFRVPLVDTLACALFNNRVLAEDAFITEEGAVLMTDDALRRCITQFEKKLQNTHQYLNGQAMTYERILREQVKQYKKVIEGVADTYQPVIVR